jgi:threonine synthase
LRHSCTAGIRSYDLLDAAERSDKDWIMVSTAHAAKFEGIVEPLIGARVPVPDALQRILSRPSRVTSIGPDLDALAGALQQHFGA